MAHSGVLMTLASSDKTPVLKPGSREVNVYANES